MKLFYPLLHLSTGCSFLSKHYRIARVLLACILTVSLSSCWKVNVVESSADEDEEHSLSENNHATKFFSFGQGEKKVKEKVKEEEEEFNAIKYNVILWDNNSVEQLDMEFVAEKPEVIDKVVSIDEQSFDFAGHSAIKYRYMPDDQPYLDMLNSPYYLELGWHFANTKDSKEVQNTSINHAKKAYKFARQLMGDEGGKVVTDMLEGKVIKDRVVQGKKIAQAKCEFYNCMLVIEHNKVTTP